MTPISSPITRPSSTGDGSNVPFPSIESPPGPLPNPISDPSTHPNNIMLQRAKELRRVEFLATYGDYAGRLFETIREVAMEQKRSLPKTVAALGNALFHEARNGGGKNTEIVKDCACVLHNEGYDVDMSLSMMAIELYTRRNEVCHAAVGSKTLRVQSEAWHEIIESDMVGISKNLPEHYATYRAIAPRLVTFYRDSHVRKRTKKMADTHSQVMVPNLSGMMAIQRERAFEQGEFRQPDISPTSTRKKAISNPMPFDARKRKASDSPKPTQAPKKPRAAPEDAYLRVLRDFNRELEELHEISAGKAQEVREKARADIRAAVENKGRGNKKRK